MSNSDSTCKANLSGELSLLNIDVNESNNEEKESANSEIINSITVCAACGKGGDGDTMNTCNKCDLVKYCNAACKKKHKSKHKKKCERRVAELYDDKLFEEPPPPEECPICFLPLPFYMSESTFESCCGKSICNGCEFAMVESGAKRLCAYCRIPPARSAVEEVRRLKKLMEKGNADAYYQFASFYAHGIEGLPQDRAKANELFLKAGELGCADAYYNLGRSYERGMGVDIDTEKAKHYYELAAMNGDAAARHNLGILEGQTGNDQRVKKHFLLAARAGHKGSLENIKQGFMNGLVTKEEYANTLREYQKSQDEMKSEARDKARAFCNRQR